MNKKYILFIIVIVLIAAGIYWVHKQSNMPAVESETKPVAAVRVIPLNRGKIDKTITAYGTVVAALGQTQTFSVPFESQVREVLVTTGQAVDPNEPMIRISPSPDTLLKFAQAKEERNAEKNNVDLVRQQIDLKLATRQDLISAQQRYEAAELNLQNMQAQGFDKNQTILVVLIIVGALLAVAGLAMMAQAIGKANKQDEGESKRFGLLLDEIKGLRQDLQDFLIKQDGDS